MHLIETIFASVSENSCRICIYIRKFIICNHIWDFDQITDVTALPIDETTLTISGGRFTTIANSAESKYTYYSRGIAIRRSNVIVTGLEHRITGERDISIIGRLHP